MKKGYRSNVNLKKDNGGSQLKKKAWIWILSIVGLLVIAGIIYFFINMKSSNGFAEEYEDFGVMVQKVSEQELGESILVTGQIIPEDEQKIYLDAEHGEIQEYFVGENQQVAAGDPLFKYDTTEVDAAYNKAIRSKELVEKQLKIEQDEIASLANQIAEMKKQLNNGEEITTQDINLVEKEKVQSEMSIEGTKDEITTAQELINELVAQKQAMTIVSKIDGTIVKVDKNVEPTESGSSAPVVHIISSGPYKVIGTMSEFDTVKIQPEQAVIIRPKVFKDREWNGVVESISQFPEENGGMDDYGGGGNVTMYPFKVAITDDTSELRQGFHVSLEINVSGESNALAVSHMSLLVDEEDGSDYVYVIVDSLLEKRIVQLGEMNDEFVAVTEGVAEGELVVIMPDESMHDGMEVTSYDDVDEY